MKSKRQAKILEIISNTSIGTQEELMQSLTEQAFAVHTTIPGTFGKWEL